MTWADSFTVWRTVPMRKPLHFAEKYGVKKVFPTYESVFDDPEVDVVYITTPHNTHYPYMKAALEHGKHLFVEKSITLNSRELSEIARAGRRKGTGVGGGHGPSGICLYTRNSGRSWTAAAGQGADHHHELRQLQRVRYEQPLL